MRRYCRETRVAEGLRENASVTQRKLSSPHHLQSHDAVEQHCFLLRSLQEATVGAIALLSPKEAVP